MEGGNQWDPIPPLQRQRSQTFPAPPPEKYSYPENYPVNPVVYPPRPHQIMDMGTYPPPQSYYGATGPQNAYPPNQAYPSPQQAQGYPQQYPGAYPPGPSYGGSQQYPPGNPPVVNSQQYYAPPSGAPYQEQYNIQPSAPPQQSYPSPQQAYPPPPQQQNYPPQSAQQGYPPSHQSYPSGAQYGGNAQSFQAQSSYPPPPSASQQQPQTSGRKKSLLIGINYSGSVALRGCINDVKNVRNFLTTFCHFPSTPDSMMVLTDDQSDPKKQPTKFNILNAMCWLVAGARPGDSLFFHYSGHGGQVRDLDGDEEDGYDETILPMDYRTAGQIVDDEMHRILVKPLPAGVHFTILFDSCHSGTAMDLPYIYNPYGQLESSVGHSGPKFRVPTSSMDLLGMGFSLLMSETKKHKKSKKSKRPQQVQSKASFADVIMFSGCKDDQCSVDTSFAGFGASGAMSFAFIKTMEERHGSIGKMLARMRQIMSDKRFQQIPQLSSGKPLDINAPLYI